jgi:rare lipoprotein A
MTSRNLAFAAISCVIIIALAFGLWCGWKIRGNYSLAQAPAAAGPEPDLANLEARAESALDEIRTLYQGMTVLASWYGSESGAVTASGERYDPMRFTAAHRTLPFNSFVIVENTANGRLAIARINDRGPNRRLHRREIDLSYGVARELGMVEDGLATVRVWAIRIPAETRAIGRPSEGD